MSWSRKPYIDRIVPYEPGRPIEEVRRELGLKRIDKLASNENPLGVSKKVKKALAAFLPNIHYYPESTGPLLLAALSQKLRVPADQIILGNGSNEIIEFLCRSLISEGDEVASSASTFLVYPILTQTCGGVYREAPMKNFGYDLEALERMIGKKTKVVFIANPNNPTGSYIHSDALNRFIERVSKEVIICLDEAYVDFVDAPDFPNGLTYVARACPNVIVLRTFSKSYGLAGLRIGFGVAQRELISYLHKVRQPFNVNAAAQTAALAVLGDRAYFRETQKVVREGRTFLCREFRRLGLAFVPSQANFVLVDLGRDSREVSKRLLREGIIVRGMHAYGLPNHIRVTVGRPAQNKRFVRALGKIL